MSMSLPGPLPLNRDAVPADRPAIVEFNRLLAAETEHKVVDPAILLPSVTCHLSSVICHLLSVICHLLSDPSAGRATSVSSHAFSSSFNCRVRSG